MKYKTGEAPQPNDEVLGQFEGQPARGRVLAVRENGDVLVTRRAPYSGSSKPLVAEHREIPADSLALVYRPARPGPGPAVKTPAAAVEAAKKGKAKAGAGADKK